MCFTMPKLFLTEQILQRPISKYPQMKTFFFYAGLGDIISYTRDIMSTKGSPVRWRNPGQLILLFRQKELGEPGARESPKTQKPLIFCFPNMVTLIQVFDQNNSENIWSSKRIKSLWKAESSSYSVKYKERKKLIL